MAGGRAVKTGWLWVPRLLLAGLFLYSGWTKVLDPGLFARAVRGYGLLPASWVPAVSLLLPWLEIWSAVALCLVPPFRAAAALWILLLLGVFTAAKASALLRGLEIPCGCARSLEPMTWRSLLANLPWIALALPLPRWERRLRG